MTRSDDTFIPLEQRPTVANSTPHSIFVAMHFNDARQSRRERLRDLLDHAARRALDRR